MKKKKEEVYMRIYRILCEKYVYIALITRSES